MHAGFVFLSPSISGNKIGSEGFKMLAELLSKLMFLKELYLGGTPAAFFGKIFEMASHWDFCIV
jgi:hypothetical protein